jgi:hypothetical protein
LPVPGQSITNISFAEAVGKEGNVVLGLGRRLGLVVESYLG